jgi:hypothetical protein
MDAKAVLAVVEKELGADAEFYQDLKRAGLDEVAAAFAMDMRIARRAVERKLQKQGLHRQPTHEEVLRVWARM